jgi:Cysteine rich repeat
MVLSKTSATVTAQQINDEDGDTEMLKIVFAAIAILSISATTSMAQNAVAKQCAADIKTQCAGVQPGEGRIRACIESHVNDLSAPCQAVLAKAAELRKVCGDDAKKNCADVKPGGGRIAACMKTHLADVSQPCKDAMAQMAAGKN